MPLRMIFGVGNVMLSRRRRYASEAVRGALSVVGGTLMEMRKPLRAEDVSTTRCTVDTVAMSLDRPDR